MGPQYPPFAVLLSATNGVISGGIPRGFLRSGGTVVDAFGYPEANVPCNQERDAAFALVQFGANFLWGQARAKTPVPGRPC